MKAVEPYTALALQTPCHAINRAPDTATARQWMMGNVQRVGRQIRASKLFVGADVRLVVLPEYFASSYPAGEPLPLWAERAAWAIDGPEYAAMATIAVDNQVFVSGNVYELDPHFPGLYFQCSFIIDDQGATVLRYRRLVSMFAPTPHDVWDAYLERYGIDSVFPVADTVLGRLACIASEEILYPEIARALALRGAEVFLHSTSEVGSPRLTPKDVAKRARAYENMAWVVSANSAGIVNSDFPSQSTDGMSKVVDHKGEVRAEAGFGESMVAHAEVDIAAVRRARAKPGMANVLSRQRLELFREVYAGSVYPVGTMLDATGVLKVPERSHFIATQLRRSHRALVRTSTHAARRRGAAPGNDSFCAHRTAPRALRRARHHQPVELADAAIAHRRRTGASGGLRGADQTFGDHAAFCRPVARDHRTRAGTRRRVALHHRRCRDRPGLGALGRCGVFHWQREDGTARRRPGDGSLHSKLSGTRRQRPGAGVGGCRPRPRRPITGLGRHGRRRAIVHVDRTRLR